MTNREFFITRWESEQPAFLKVLRAIPEGQLAYKPHERSSAAGAVAWQLAEEQKQLCELLDTGEIHFEMKLHPEKVSDIATAYEKATNDLRGKLKSASDEKWSSNGKFMSKGNVAWSDSVQNLCWGYLFDMVHHRGQLSAYLRPMGGKVPAIYGPSADDAGA
jgi:uncharacterized damage-inducible protein DinB